MCKDDKEIVSSFRLALAARVGQERYELWFGNGVQLSCDASRLTVAASESFVLERLKKSFRDDLASVAAEVWSERIEVCFRVDASLAVESIATPNKTAAGKKSDRTPEANNDPCIRTLGSGRPRKSLATFDEFVVGDANRLGVMSARSMLQRMGQMSPLFLYGPPGSGKTHLLEAITCAARRVPGMRRVVLLSSEQFTRYFVEALQGSGLPNFRRKYRDADMLLVDDLQVLVGKRATIVEFQHTIDTLLREGKQLVFAADRPPAELRALGSELFARIAGGLVCSLESLDEATRKRLLIQQAERRQLSMPASVAELIAIRLQGDARLLTGALNRLQAASEALGQPITDSLAETALADLFHSTGRVIQLNDIESAICDVFGIDSVSLQSPRKRKTVSQPRMLAMWLARKYTRAAFSEIGEYFGRRSHSTVISAQKKVETWVSTGAEIQLGPNPCQVRDAIRRVEAKLRAS